MREKDPMPDAQTGRPVRARDSEREALRKRVSELEKSLRDQSLPRPTLSPEDGCRSQSRAAHVSDFIKNIDSLREREPITKAEICRVTGIPYSTFTRWKARMTAGLPPIATPGPKPKRNLVTK